MKLPKELTTVTPLSKFIAVILFIALPLAGFLIGMRYQEMIDLAKRQEMEANLSIKRTPTPTLTPIAIPTVDPSITANWKTYRNEKSGFLFKYPENRFPYFSNYLEIDDPLSLFIAPAKEAENLRVTDIWISVSAIAYPIDMTLDEYLKLDGNQDFYRDTKKEPKEIIGEQGYKITRHPDKNAQREDSFSYTGTIKKDEYIYTIRLGAFSEDIFVSNEKLFDQILSTFQFTP